MLQERRLFYIMAVFVAIFAFAAFWVLPGSKEKTYSFETKAFDLTPGDKAGVFDIKKDYPSPGDGFITAISTEVIGAPKDTLHHIVFSYMGRQDTTCPNFPQRIFAVAKELTRVKLPPGFGYPISRHDNFSAFTHMYNPHDQVFKNVRVKINVRFKPKTLGVQFKNVEPIWLGIVNCSLDPTFLIEPKQTKVFSLTPKIIVPFDASVVFAGAHFHDYGTNLGVLLDGKQVFNFEPQTVGHSIEKIPAVTQMDGDRLKIKKGQVLDIVSTYQNPTEETIDGMGIAIIYLAKD